MSLQASDSLPYLRKIRSGQPKQEHLYVVIRGSRFHMTTYPQTKLSKKGSHWGAGALISLGSKPQAPPTRLGLFLVGWWFQPL